MYKFKILNVDYVHIDYNAPSMMRVVELEKPWRVSDHKGESTWFKTYEEARAHVAERLSGDSPDVRIVPRPKRLVHH